MPSDRNWAFDPGFDEATMDEFERRLARANVANRPGYLRVKGLTLLEHGERRPTEVAVGLLRRVVDEHDHPIEVPWSHELLGTAYRRLGDLEAAEHHLRRCLATVDDRGNGTTDATRVSLAEVLLDQGRVGDAGVVLAEQDPTRLFWKSQAFRYLVACARYEDRSGGDPGPWANEALELLADDSPQLPRDPSIGAIDADRSTRRELERLASRT